MTDDTTGDEGGFDHHAPRYHDFFPAGSREDLEFRLTRQLIVVTRWWTTHIEERIRAGTGQTRARWQVLFALVFLDQPPTTLALSDQLGVQWPTLVRTLNALEEEGLVARVVNPDDGRSRLVSITAAGRAVVDAVLPILVPTRKKILAALSDEDIRGMTRTLGVIRQALAEA